MTALTATPKGAATRDAILDRAYSIACSSGLEGLSIGPLAQAVGMSKSGVFAHFGSREDLQLAVLDAAGRRFIDGVLVPALRAPRGLPRLRAIVRNWFDWVRHTTGGCILLGSVTEYDDRPGALRDRVLEHNRRWRAELARAVAMAVDNGELAPSTDPGQVVFELYAIALAVHHDAGLFGFETARAQGERALESLIKAHSP